MTAEPANPILPRLKINAALATRILTGFIRDSITKAGMERAVIGLSGGIDSAGSGLSVGAGFGREERPRLANALSHVLGGKPERCRSGN